MGQGAGIESGGVEGVLDIDAGDYTFTAVGTGLVVDLSGDFTDVDQEQALFLGPGTGAVGDAGDVGGEELDVAVGEEPQPQPSDESSAPSVARACAAAASGARWGWRGVHGVQTSLPACPAQSL